MKESLVVTVPIRDGSRRMEMYRPSEMLTMSKVSLDVPDDKIHLVNTETGKSIKTENDIKNFPG